jgi:hypothetical protein
MEGIELIKVKYTHSQDTFPTLTLELIMKDRIVKIGTVCGGGGSLWERGG